MNVGEASHPLDLTPRAVRAAPGARRARTSPAGRWSRPPRKRDLQRGMAISTKKQSDSSKRLPWLAIFLCIVCGLSKAAGLAGSGQAAEQAAADAKSAQDVLDAATLALVADVKKGTEEYKAAQAAAGSTGDAADEKTMTNEHTATKEAASNATGAEYYDNPALWWTTHAEREEV